LRLIIKRRQTIEARKREEREKKLEAGKQEDLQLPN
jgi:hypothetical protein